jgi:hypothetical protein
MAKSTRTARPRTVANLVRTRIGLSAVPITALLLLVAAPLAGAANISPAYHGSAVPSVYLEWNGCSKEKATNPTFSLKTGTGSLGSIKGKSDACGNSNIPTTSDVYVQTAVTANILLHIPSGVHNVTPTLNGSWVASDLITSKGLCPATSSTIDKKNNETKRLGYFDLDWTNTTTFSGFCETLAYVDVAASVLLVDETNQTYVPVSVGTGCTYAYTECYADLVDNETYTENSTYWTSYTDTNLNATGYSYSNGTTNSNFSGSSSWTSFSSSGSASVTPSFIDRFVGGHTYYLVVTWYATFELYVVGWHGGAASGKLDVSGSTGGVSIPHVKVV